MYGYGLARFAWLRGDSPGNGSGSRLPGPSSAAAHDLRPREWPEQRNPETCSTVLCGCHTGRRGRGGVLLGIAATAAYAFTQGWPAVVPVAVTGAAMVAPLVIGALAGLYPAVRAARLSPTEALA